jgi:hypothetical protein
MALVTANVAQLVVPAAETSPASIAGTAPSYGPKSVSRVPNAAAIVRRIWLPELDAGYDPQGHCQLNGPRAPFSGPARLQRGQHGRRVKEFPDPELTRHRHQEHTTAA